MSTLVTSLNNKYSDDEDEDTSYGFIVFISCSPEAKKGLLPNIITLNEYHIERVGDFSGLSLEHVVELDLTDNLISEWSEVLNILSAFPRLTFLNLSNNLLTSPSDNININHSKLNMKKLVLNGNKLDWGSVVYLTDRMDRLEELHLSTNSLKDINNNTFKHPRLRCLYLSCNPIKDFQTVHDNLVNHCPRLEFLSLSECPVHGIPEMKNKSTSLQSLNVSTTAVNSWEDVDRLQHFPALSELRIQGCQFLDEYTAHERRMMLIARLPNIKVLNGGDCISPSEREDAERAFIRYFLDTPADDRPPRFDQLTQIHGLLVPLANIDLSPEVNILVKIYRGEECRHERISVRQTVKHFKLNLQKMFNIVPSNMRLYYYDQEMSKIAGPEEMKWGNKGLYTYNVREGDYFVVDVKTTLKPLKTTRSISTPINMKNNSSSPKGYTSLNAKTGSKTRRYSSGCKSGLGTSTSPGDRVGVSRPQFSGDKSPVSRNLFNGEKSPVNRSQVNGEKSTVSRSQTNGEKTTGNRSQVNGEKSPSYRSSFNTRKYGEYHHSKVFPDTG